MIYLVVFVSTDHRLPMTCVDNEPLTFRSETKSCARIMAIIFLLRFSAFILALIVVVVVVDERPSDLVST